MFADGTLYFYAEIDRLIDELGHKSLIRCTYPMNSIVEQVLSHIGIFDLLKKKPRQPATHSTVRHWCFAKGTEVEGVKMAELAALYEDQVAEFNTGYQGQMAEPLQSSNKSNNLYDGLVEAMTNCRHAYPGKRMRPWWMFSQLRNGILSVAFCDLGIGIPESLRTSGTWTEQMLSVVLTFLRRPKGNEGDLIQAAFELGKTATKEKHRGKGLTDLKDVIAKTGRGRLYVASGYGVYRYSSRNESEETYVADQNFPGTMICWNIPMREGVDDGNELQD